MLILITGGVKSGKSRRALEIAKSEWAFPVSFIATAETNRRIAMAADRLELMVCWIPVRVK